MFSLILLQIWSDWGILALRVALGLIFIVHGWPKLKNLKSTAQGFAAMGFRPGSFFGPLVAVVEFAGGIALLLGFYAQIAAAVFAVEFLVIMIWKLVKRNHFVGGYEFDLLILAAVLALMTLGGGTFSLDKFFWGF